MNRASHSTLSSAPALVAAAFLLLSTLDVIRTSGWAIYAVAATSLVSILSVRGVRRYRVAAGVALGLLVTASVSLRTAGIERKPHSTLPWRDVAVVRGRVIADLRPGADTYRRLDIALDSVESRRGWRASATGTVTLLWSGAEHIVTQDRSSSVVPVRGDTVIAYDVTLSGERGVWVEPTALRCIPAEGAVAIRRSIRRTVRRRLARLEPTSRAFVTALLLGTRADMASDLVESVRRAGAAHVIALSGMHLGVLGLIVSRLLSPIGDRRVVMVLTAAALGVYVWIVGWIPSLVRAVVLAFIVLWARLRDRTVPPVVLLARCVVCVAIIAPGMVTDVGFRLSIGALLGLIVAARRISDGLTEIVPHCVAVYLGTTISAMLFTAPLTLTVFGTVYPIGIITAGILSLAVVVVMCLGMSFLLFARVAVVGTVLGSTVEVAAELFLRLARLAALAPAIDTTYAGGRWGLAALCGAAAVCFAAVRIRRRRRRARFRNNCEGVGEPQLGF